MRRILEGVIPVGTPWGGPESRRYLSCFVSMLMRIERREGAEKDLQAAHERLYHLYLAVSGMGVSTIWSEGLASCSHDRIVERLLGDTVERTMAYAGYRYTVLEEAAIRGDRDAVRRRVVASIDQGIPVLARSTAAEWSLVAGYDRDGATLIGWDGAHTYWGPPTIQPEGYLENGMFSTASWPESVSRFVVVEEQTAPKASSVEVLRHLVSVMEEQRPQGYEGELLAFLQDDAFCGAADLQSLRSVWAYANGYVGWYAENRCFTGFALGDILPTMADIREITPAVDRLKGAAGYMSHTHDLCWEAWRSMFATHQCDLPEYIPCHMCGGCLRPATDADLEAFRDPEPRRKLSGCIRTINWNDGKMLAELKGCLAVL